MVYRIQLEQFEGPLDLLLRLIEEQRMDITTVSLAHVAEQFLSYLESATDLRAEEMADFLVVAAKLLLIKSRVLLPSLAQGEDDGVDLEKQLRMYRLYYEASKKMQGMLKERWYSFVRGASLRIAPTERKFRPPERIGMEDLARFFRVVLKRLEPFITLPEETLQKTLSLREKLDAIRERILTEASLNFQALLAQASTKTEIIVTFLALLELVKQRTIVVVQDDMFSNIEIRRYPETIAIYEQSEAVR